MNLAGQSWHRPGTFYSDIRIVNSAIGKNSRAWPDAWKWDRQYSKMTCHYPRESCNKRSMDEQTAFASIRATTDVLEKTPPIVMPKYDLRRGATPRQGTISKWGRMIQDQESIAECKKRVTGIGSIWGCKRS